MTAFGREYGQEPPRGGSAQPPMPLEEPLLTAAPSKCTGGLERRQGLAEHWRGVVCMLGGVAALVPDATLLRLVHAGSLTVAAWRLGITATVLGAWLIGQHGRDIIDLPWRLGRWGLLIGASAAFSNLCFILAVKSTTVANVLLILATSAFWAAIFSRVLLGVQVPPRTLAAMPVVFGGVAVAVGPGLVGGGLQAGDLWALLTTFLGAARRTAIRAHADVDMVPALVLGSLMGSACLMLGLAAEGASLKLAMGDLPPLLFLGAVCIPTALVLTTQGSRLLSSAESSMIMCLETVLSPILASVVLNECLPSEAWLGGAIVVSALACHAAWPMLQHRRTSVAVEAAS